MRILLSILLLIFFLGMLINRDNLKKNFKEAFYQFKGIHYAWVILFIAILNFGKIESSSMIASNGVQIALVAVAGMIIGLSLLSRFHYAFASVRMPLLCLIIYGVTGILSGVVSPLPAFSVYKAFLILLGSFGCMLFLSYKPQYRYGTLALDLSLIFYWIMFLVIILGGIISPERAFEKSKVDMVLPMISGWIVLTNSNSVGVISGIVSLLSLNRSMKHQPNKLKLFYILSFGVSISILVLAQSRTCIAAYILGCALILLKKQKRYLLILFGMILLAASLIGLSGVKQGVESYIIRGQTTEQFESWSGRLPAWQYSIERFKENPIMGYGMAAGVRFGAVSDALKGSHLHSSYFEVLLNSGLIGFIPWFVALFWLIGGVFRRFFFPPKWFTPSMKDRHIEVSAILLFLVIRSIAGTTFVAFDHSLMLYLAMVAYGTSVTRKEFCVTVEKK